MGEPSEIPSKSKEEIVNDSKNRDYILSNTGTSSVSCYEHLILAAGIEVAVGKEFLRRGKSPEDIYGRNISEKFLVSSCEPPLMRYE
ncbi:MAG: hypothetical protein QXR19_11190 [Candidatus Jordarchaeaceae archaeon]